MPLAVPSHAWGLCWLSRSHDGSYVPSRIYLPIKWQSPLTTPQASAWFPQMGLGSSRGCALCPFPPLSPLGIGSSPRRWQWAQGHPSLGSNKPSGLGDLRVFPTCSSPTPGCLLFSEFSCCLAQSIYQIRVSYQGESPWEESLEIGRRGERVALTNSSRGLWSQFPCCGSLASKPRRTGDALGSTERKQTGASSILDV